MVDNWRIFVVDQVTNDAEGMGDGLLMPIAATGAFRMRTIELVASLVTFPLFFLNRVIRLTPVVVANHQYRNCEVGVFIF